MMSERKYPFGMQAMSQYGHRSTHIWMGPSKDNHDQFKLEWHEDTPDVIIVKKMTDPGSYWFNNWNNTQGGTPSAWEQIDTIAVGDVKEVFAVMQKYASEKFGVTDIR